MAYKKFFPKGLEHAWVCTRIGEEVFHRWNKLAEGEQVAHIEHKAFIDGKSVDRKSPITPSHHTFTRAELQNMVTSGKDHIGLPLGVSFGKAVGDALLKFGEMDTAKAAPEPVRFELVETRREEAAPVVRAVPALVA